MSEDPIVEEVRSAGQAYIESFRGDRAALLADLRRRAQNEGRHLVSLPPKPPEQEQPQRAG